MIHRDGFSGPHVQNVCMIYFERPTVPEADRRREGVNDGG